MNTNELERLDLIQPKDSHAQLARKSINSSKSSAKYDGDGKEEAKNKEIEPKALNETEFSQKMQKRHKSMQKDLKAYQKLVKDQSECIESLHSTKSDEKNLLR